MMATISMARFIFVLPVPVTPFSQMLATLMMSNPVVTTLNTGIPCSTNSGPCPNKRKNCKGKIFTSRHITLQQAILSSMILLITSITLSSRRCPIRLLTMVLLVPAKAHTNTPVSPKIFRMVLLMALALSSWRDSIKIKNTSQVVTLITNCSISGVAIRMICLLFSLLYSKLCSREYSFVNPAFIKTINTTKKPVHSAITEATAAPLKPIFGKPK